MGIIPIGTKSTVRNGAIPASTSSRRPCARARARARRMLAALARILIVGGGQAGLQLALGLLQNGYDVTVVSNRTPDDIRAGRGMSSQCMFDRALQHERDLGLSHWEDECPPVEGIQLAVPAPDGSGKAIDFAS